MDNITLTKRKRGSIDGRASDRFMMFIIATCCWHLFSAWRRNPFAQDPSQTSILIEEGVLMSITIVLAVWSISNRGKKKGWRVFQGQSAMFWGVSFGYAYGGSIASLSAVSGGFLDLVTITALGHLITAISIIIILPISIGLVGVVKRVDLAANGHNNQVNESINQVTEDLESAEDSTFSRTEEKVSEDLVELLD